MISNYCIAGLRSLKKLPHLDCAQFTLNGRQYPAKRNTLSLLKEMAPYYKDTDILVHYDFIYIISRFALLSRNTQKAILDECIEICDYAATNPRIKGIIMHTDYPLQRDCYLPKIDHQKITDSYKSSLWDVDAIHRCCDVMESCGFSILEQSLDLFTSSLRILHPSPLGCKIYLENTTKFGPNKEGTFRWLVDYVQNRHNYDIFGVCYDTEHEFASTGQIYDLLHDVAPYFPYISFVVHLNTIPPEVTPESRKDRHSDTTIYECSVNGSDFYFDYARALCSAGVPFVREIKEDTMQRELKQQNQI